MNNKRNFKNIKLIACSLSLISILSSCSNEKNIEDKPQLIYVYVTATPTPIQEINTTEPSVFENTNFNNDYFYEDTNIYDLIPTYNTESTYQTTIYDDWWILNEEERQFWNNINSKQAEINDTIENFSWAEAREDAINQAKTLIDFIFYNGTINGMTYDELSMVGRLELYTILQALDSKIMEFFPDYKTDLGESYNRVRSFSSTTLERAREIFNNNIEINDYSSENTMNFQGERKSFKLKNNG